MPRTAFTPSAHVQARHGQSDGRRHGQKARKGHAATLFGEVEPVELPGDGSADGSHPPPEGPFAAVALEQSIDRMLDYAIPPHLVASLQVGQRVRVPLGKGNRPVAGYVVAIHDSTDYPRIKRLFDIEDARVLIPPR